MSFKSTHNLLFEVAEYPHQLVAGVTWMAFRVGSVEGLFCDSGDSYAILAVMNNKPGSGHFTDVLEWFEHSCKRDNKKFRILEVWNEKFRKRLIEKHGFIIENKDSLIKIIK